MGIPGYFVDLLKRNRKVLQLIQDSKNADVLCVDANGVIYEVVRRVEQEEDKSAGKDLVRPSPRLGSLPPKDAAVRLAPLITAELARLPELTCVSDVYFVAFDGVAPAAKIAQQRQRRFGRLIQTEAMRQVRAAPSAGVGGEGADAVPRFDTTQITPATSFMTTLMPLLETQLKHAVRVQFKFSGSDEPGEGEHKIMEMCRSGLWKAKDVVVHGLDADLILLALANQHHCGSLRLAREAPGFIKHLDKTMDPHATYMLDIPRFSAILNRSMSGTSTENLAGTDYVFMMSMLGNDFMPHQPAISIRDNGIERVCKAYKACRVTSPNFRLLAGNGTDGHGGLSPHWPSVHLLLKELGGQEDTVMAKFAKRRQGFAHQATFPSSAPTGATSDDLETIWNQLPQLQSGLENFIAAGSEGWRERYYQHLLGDMVAVRAEAELGKGKDKTNTRTLWSPWLEVNTEHWLQGLQWVWEYYTRRTPHWNWVYAGSHPPPLLHELAELGNYDQSQDKLSDWRSESLPMTNAEQLAQVLPPRSEKGHWILPSVNLHWEYCRHGWEAELFS